MFFLPALRSGLDWTYLQNVWDRWQALNVGLLALVSSIYFYRGSQQVSESARASKFIAAKSLALHKLPYVIKFLQNSVLKLSEFNNGSIYLEKDGVSFEQLDLSSLHDCIVYSKDASTQNHFSFLISELQVFNSRLELYTDEGFQKKLLLDRLSHENMMFKAATIKSLIDQSFNFCRENNSSLSDEVTYDEIENACRALDICNQSFEYKDYFKRNLPIKKYYDNP